MEEDIKSIFEDMTMSLEDLTPATKFVTFDSKNKLINFNLLLKPEYFKHIQGSAKDVALKFEGEIRYEINEFINSTHLLMTVEDSKDLELLFSNDYSISISDNYNFGISEFKSANVVVVDGLKYLQVKFTITDESQVFMMIQDLKNQKEEEK